MHSRYLVSSLPRVLPPLPPSPAPPCLPCVEGRQRAAPHSSFPPTEAPLQTLHLDVWGPARVRGQGHERYFLLVVDDYTRYTTVFPLRAKGEVPDVLIPWIRAARLQLRERFQSDFPILRLHSDRGAARAPASPCGAPCLSSIRPLSHPPPTFLSPLWSPPSLTPSSASFLSSSATGDTSLCPVVVLLRTSPHNPPLHPPPPLLSPSFPPPSNSLLCLPPLPICRSWLLTLSRSRAPSHTFPSASYFSPQRRSSRLLRQYSSVSYFSPLRRRSRLLCQYSSASYFSPQRRSSRLLCQYSSASYFSPQKQSSRLLHHYSSASYFSPQRLSSRLLQLYSSASYFSPQRRSGRLLRHYSSASYFSLHLLRSGLICQYSSSSFVSLHLPCCYLLTSPPMAPILAVSSLPLRGCLPTPVTVPLGLPLLPLPFVPDALSPPRTASPTCCSIPSPISSPLSHHRRQPSALALFAVATPGAGPLPSVSSVTLPSPASILGASPLMEPRFALPFPPFSDGAASPHSFPTIAALSLPRTLDFVLDSGATDSIFRDADILCSFLRPLSIHGAGETMILTCTGTSSLSYPASPSCTVTGLYVPSCHHNLLSLMVHSKLLHGLPSSLPPLPPSPAPPCTPLLAPFEYGAVSLMSLSILLIGHVKVGNSLPRHNSVHSLVSTPIVLAISSTLPPLSSSFAGRMSYLTRLALRSSLPPPPHLLPLSIALTLISYLLLLPPHLPSPPLLFHPSRLPLLPSPSAITSGTSSPASSSSAPIPSPSSPPTISLPFVPIPPPSPCLTCSITHAMSKFQHSALFTRLSPSQDPDLLEDRFEELFSVHPVSPLLCVTIGDFRNSTTLLSVDTATIPAPQTYSEAVSGFHATKRMEAIIAECEAFTRTNSYVDSVPPLGATIVKGKWVFRVKQLRGELPIFKARYCVKGFTQHAGIDYFATFSPTARLPTLRLLDLGARWDWEIHSMDISNAFLQGELHERIFLERPAGFPRPFPPSTVWELKRPVYGLKQAPRKWHAKLASTLHSLGFSTSSSDPSLFIRTSPCRLYILAYVDDLVLLTEDSADLAAVKKALQARLLARILASYDTTLAWRFVVIMLRALYLSPNLSTSTPSSSVRFPLPSQVAADANLADIFTKALLRAPHCFYIRGHGLTRLAASGGVPVH
ncbi:unnamed protein product [Closterium sp. NIES-54]